MPVQAQVVPYLAEKRFSLDESPGQITLAGLAGVLLDGAEVVARELGYRREKQRRRPHRRGLHGRLIEKMSVGGPARGEGDEEKESM